MEPAPSNTPRTCRSSLWSVTRFGLLVVLLSAILTLLALPWMDLPWVKIFRRCVSVAAALSLWICIHRLEGRSFASYGLMRNGATRQLLTGCALGLLALVVLLAVGLASGACRVELTTDRARLIRTVFGFAPAALLVGLLEELVFRGYLFQHLLRCSVWLGLGASSVLYAVVHLKTWVPGLLGWQELGGLALFGGVLTMSYLRTGGLWLAIGLHAVLAYGVRVNKLLIAFTDPSQAWLVGTHRLVNGLAIWIALAGLAVAILVVTRPRRRDA